VKREKNERLGKNFRGKGGRKAQRITEKGLEKDFAQKKEGFSRKTRSVAEGGAAPVGEKFKDQDSQN